MHLFGVDASILETSMNEKIGPRRATVQPTQKKKRMDY